MASFANRQYGSILPLSVFFMPGNKSLVNLAGSVQMTGYCSKSKLLSLWIRTQQSFSYDPLQSTGREW